MMAAAVSMEYSIYESVWVSPMCVDVRNSIGSVRYVIGVSQFDEQVTGRSKW